MNLWGRRNAGFFTQNLRPPGQYSDGESGLWHNYFRSLDPTAARYNTSDPMALRAASIHLPMSAAIRCMVEIRLGNF